MFTPKRETNEGTLPILSLCQKSIQICGHVMKLYFVLFSSNINPKYSVYMSKLFIDLRYLEIRFGYFR